MAAFVRKAGFGGLLVSLDGLVVLSHRLTSSRARQANYEALLTILAGTDECLEDNRRGLFSYQALRTRLADNALTQKTLRDLAGPVIRLNALTPEETPEDIFVLLKNIALVHANGIPENVRVPDAGIIAMLRKANQPLGSDYFRTPRDIVRSFVSLLNLLDQNARKHWTDILDNEPLGEHRKPIPLKRN